jgi:hypothetical protein
MKKAVHKPKSSTQNENQKKSYKIEQKKKLVNKTSNSKEIDELKQRSHNQEEA